MGFRGENQIRQCWKCSKILTFPDFYSINKSLGNKRAHQLWENHLLQFLCCSCFRKEEVKRLEEIRRQIKETAIKRQCQIQRERIQGRKVIFCGVENAGKTSIINILRYKSCEKTINLLPTRGKDIHDLLINNVRYIIWGLGGVLAYRKRWVEAKYAIFTESNELIFSIDVQDTSNYVDSIQYLSEIIQLLNHMEIEETFFPDFSVHILLHKVDPRIIETPKINENMDFLINQVEELEISFNFEINTTSLYNFKHNYTEELFCHSLKFGGLVSDLLSIS